MPIFSVRSGLGIRKLNYPQHYGEIFAKARDGKQDVETDLISLSQDKQQANIVRATAIELLTQYDRPKSIQARIDALAHCFDLMY